MTTFINKQNSKKKVPLPNTKYFINGELVEVVKLSWNNGTIANYFCTVKCKLHIGCSCGIKNLLKVFENSENETFPRVTSVRNLTLLYGPPVITPMITREIDTDNAENGVGDTYELYGELDLLNEINFNNELYLMKKNKCYDRQLLLKKYGALINAAPVKAIKAPLNIIR